MGRRRGWRTQLARLYVWLLRLPVAGAHVTPLGGRRRLAVTATSLRGGHGQLGDIIGPIRLSPARLKIVP